MYRSFVFDKDGVLVDTEWGKARSYYLAVNRLCPGMIGGDDYPR